MRKACAVLAVAGPVLFGACSGGEATTEPTTTESTTTTSTTTTTIATTTTLSPQQAAQVAYFTIVSEVNPAREVVEKSYRGEDLAGDVAWPQIPAYCRELATIQERYVNLMSTTQWPEQFQEQITKVIGSNSVETQLLLECANTPGTADAQSDVQSRLVAAIDAAAADVSTLRGILGLPIER